METNTHNDFRLVAKKKEPQHDDVGSIGSGVGRRQIYIWEGEVKDTVPVM